MNVTPEIILGPPGCGKTTTLINLVDEELARGTLPERIGYVSFTRKAAEEASSRAQQKFGLTRKDFPYFSTLHSLCFRCLGMERKDVLEGARLQQFAAYAGVRFTGKFSEDGTRAGFEPGDRILFMENLARIRGLTLREQFNRECDGLSWREVDRVSRALCEYKHDTGLQDFTDMLQDFLKSKITVPLDVLLVDEAQDLSALQWQVVGQLARGVRRVAVAGDDDQAIYRWAGADVDHLIDMQGDARVLGQSWRVPPPVQAAANAVIAPVKHRREKQWTPRTGGEGQVVRVNNFADVMLGKEGSVLVLARNSYVLREQVEGLLRYRGVVWERYGRSSIDQKLVDAARCWERLRRGADAAVTGAEARKLYAWMTSGRGVARGHKTLKGVEDEQFVTAEDLCTRHGLLAPLTVPWFDVLDRAPKEDVTYVRAALKNNTRLDEKPRVVLSTIHGAKGGEADHVIVLREMATRTHGEMTKSRETEDDERRVWYVAATRARERLTVVEAKTQRRCPWL